MSFEVKGLTEFQNDLLKVANKRLPKESKQIMRKIGSKARTHVARKGRKEVKKIVNGRVNTGNYQKKFKRGKPFVNKDGETVVRVINSAPHAHLIEYGHRVVSRDGKEHGFEPGRHIVSRGIDDFDDSGQYESMLSDWIDDLLKDGKL